MGDAANVRVGADGQAFFAPTDTTLPTDWDTTLDTAFVDLGFVTEDGLTEKRSVSTEKIKNWKGTTVRELLTDSSFQFDIGFLEDNENVLEVFYGSAPKDGVAGGQGTRGCWVFDVFDGDEVIRYILPDGQIVDWDDLAHKNSDAIKYGVTITAYPDTEGNSFYRPASTDTGS